MPWQLKSKRTSIGLRGESKTWPLWTLFVIVLDEEQGIEIGLFGAKVGGIRRGAGNHMRVKLRAHSTQFTQHTETCRRVLHRIRLLLAIMLSLA